MLYQDSTPVQHKKTNNESEIKPPAKNRNNFKVKICDFNRSALDLKKRKHGWVLKAFYLAQEHKLQKETPRVQK